MLVQKQKVILVFGTRPEAIKMAPLVLKLRDNPLVDLKLCITAQHRQMLDQVLDFFEIKPDYDLDLMKSNQSLNQLASRILQSFDKVLEDENPDWVFVHGDTTTSSMCALAAFHRRIKVGHVEAGLRTYVKDSPFPEEINRQITGRVTDMHFAPTASSRDNLLREGVNDKQIIVTGNTVIDALHLAVRKLEYGYEDEEIKYLKSIIQPKKKVIAVTGHRRENFGGGFERICKAIKQLSDIEDVQIIFPVHLNPNVQKPVNELLAGVPNINLISPLAYPAFVYLMQSSFLLLTDSGGVQEEAPSLGKPVLVLRDNTERPEAVEAGTVKLVGTDPALIYSEVVKLIENEENYRAMATAYNPYGDGTAVAQINHLFER